MRFEPAAAGGDTAVLTLDDDITSPGWGGYSTQQLDADLAELKRAQVQRLMVRINSGGGEVQEAMAMYDALRALQGVEVVAEIRGYCCSAATLVALACDVVTMTPSSTFMVHEPKGGCYGTLADWEAGLVHFRQLRDRILQIYAERTGKPVEDVEQQVSATSWLTAQQALDGGWIDAIAGAADEPEVEPDEEEKEPDVAAEEQEAEAAVGGRGLLGWGRLKSLLRGGLLHGAGEASECSGAGVTALQQEVVAQRAAARQARADLAAERGMREEMVSREVARRLVAGGRMPAELPRAESGSEGAPVRCAADGWLAKFKSI